MKRKEHVYSMRVSQQWLDELHQLTDTINHKSILGSQARGRGAAPLTCYDIIMMAVESEFGIKDPFTSAGHKVGMGFDNGAQAADRIGREARRIRRAALSRAEKRPVLMVIEGEAA